MKDGIVRAWARLGTWGRVLAGTALGLCLAQTASAQSPLPKSILNKNTVHLPIEIEERYRPQIQEVQLWVKEGPQAPWSMREKVSGMQRHFTFRAAQDGEYSFNVVTVDKSGRSTPADVNQEAPGLVVVIDTVPPQAEARSAGTSAEGHLVQCEIRDANHDPAKTKFFYQTRDSVWRPLDAVAGQADTFCIPVQAASTGMVRIVATDQAGNTSSREVSVSALASNVGSSPGGTAPASKAGSSTVLEGPGVIVDGPNERVFVSPTPVDTLQPPSANSIIVEKVPASSGEGPKLSGPMTGKGPKPGNLPAAVSTDAAQNPLLSNVSANATSDAKPMLEKVPAGNIQTTASMHSGSPPAPGPELNVRRHLVNGTRVVLEYQIEQTGASGIGKVEVWYTRDLGQTWLKLGDDADHKSPAEVDLPGEGIFGVSLVVANGRGFGAAAPKPGDSPDWWIEVDMTKPKGDLLNVRTGNGDDGSLQITWFAKDKNLHAEPIDLYHASKREGPWQPIAKNLRNDGVYCWTPSPEIGSHTYIRLVIRDQAGNTSSSETVQAIALDDLSRPRGRVVSVATPVSRPTLAPNGIASQAPSAPSALSGPPAPPLPPRGN